MKRRRLGAAEVCDDIFPRLAGIQEKDEVNKNRGGFWEELKGALPQQGAARAAVVKTSCKKEG